MNQENKTCQNCKAVFIIEPEDFSAKGVRPRPIRLRRRSASGGDFYP